jgi:hypothetical protein
MRRPGILACVGVMSCAYNPLFPDMRTPADRARAIAPRCTHGAAASEAQMLSPALIEGVDPAYAHVPSGNGPIPRLRGALLHVRPDPSLSAESLERTLQCHEARLTMGTAEQLADDPFMMAGTWLDITTQSVGYGFVVAIEVDDFETARQVLERARRFAAPRP